MRWLRRSGRWWEKAASGIDLLSLGETSMFSPSDPWSRSGSAIMGCRFYDVGSLLDVSKKCRKSSWGSLEVCLGGRMGYGRPYLLFT